MKQSLEIDIMKESYEYIQKTFSQYTETDDPINKIEERAIIHLYPKEDTYDENGGLNGYTDALFFEGVIYDTKNMIFYRSKRKHDAVRSAVPTETRAFKDLSTMIIIDGGVTINYLQEINVHKL